MLFDECQIIIDSESWFEIMNTSINNIEAAGVHAH